MRHGMHSYYNFNYQKNQSKNTNYHKVISDFIRNVLTVSVEVKIVGNDFCRKK